MEHVISLLQRYFRYSIIRPEGNRFFIWQQVHQKASGNYVIEIKTRHIVSKTLINSVKFLHDGAEFE